MKRDPACVLTRDYFYPVADFIPLDAFFGAGAMTPRDRLTKIRAVWTGEKRPPRKGEWYLSGAIIEAYRAPNDLPTMPFAIAKLVEVVVETKTTITFKRRLT